MSNRKVIAVVGATGAQGGGLVRAILNDPNRTFAARVLTRDVNSAKAKGFARLGAEVVTADIDSSESLKRAFEGAYAAFCITFFWAHFSPEKEMAEAKAMAIAAKATALRHVLWSTLEDTRQWVPLIDNRMPTLQGKYKVLHCDGKGESNHFFTDAGVPTTFLLTSLYWENFNHFGMVRRMVRTESWSSHSRSAIRNFRGLPPRTSANVRTASSRRVRNSSGRQSRFQART